MPGRFLVLVLLFVGCAPLVASSCQRSAPESRADRPAAAASTAGNETHRTAIGTREEPALSRAPAPYALARTGLPTIGAALACSREVALGTLSEEQLAVLGPRADVVAKLTLPLVVDLHPVRVEWQSDQATTSYAWRIGKGREALYLTPWGEVLDASRDLVRSEKPIEASVLLAESLGADPNDAPAVAFAAPEGTTWGLANPATRSALRACYLAQLGNTDEARAAAEAAGDEGFAELPSALVHVAHQAAVEGLGDGWSHEWAWWTLYHVRDTAPDYAGRESLADMLDALQRMAAEDASPVSDPDGPAADVTPGGARYLVWSLRDMGGPPELRMPTAAADPVSRLLSGGPAATEVLLATLEDDRPTRQLAEQSGDPIPQVLRFGDIALELLEARTGERYRAADEQRLFALPAARRAALIRSVRKALGAAPADR